MLWDVSLTSDTSGSPYASPSEIIREREGYAQKFRIGIRSPKLRFTGAGDLRPDSSCGSGTSELAHLFGRICKRPLQPPGPDQPREREKAPVEMGLSPCSRENGEHTAGGGRHPVRGYDAGNRGSRCRHRAGVLET